MTAPLSPEREADIRESFKWWGYLYHHEVVAVLSALDHARSQLAAEREAGRQEGLRQAAAWHTAEASALDKHPLTKGELARRSWHRQSERTILALLPAEVKSDG